MPTYEYYCENCKKPFELFQPMSSEPVAECEKCKTSCRRIITGGGNFILKGSGFYSTDSKVRAKPQTQTTNSGDVTKTNISEKSQKKMKEVAS